MKAKIKNISKGRIHFYAGKIITIQPGQTTEIDLQPMFITPVMGLLTVGVAQVEITCKSSEKILFERHVRGARPFIRSRLTFNLQDEATKTEHTKEEKVETQEPEKAEEVVEELHDAIEELKKKTKKELVEIAKELGIKTHGKTKQELIDEIIDHEQGRTA